VVQTIYQSLIAINKEPMGCVGRLLPVNKNPYNISTTSNITAHANQITPAHFGSVLERQMAILKSTLPIKLSAMLIMKLTIKSTSTSIRIAS
jgi:hypothetical protein